MSRALLLLCAAALTACVESTPPAVPPAGADLARAASLEAEARSLLGQGRAADAERAALEAGRLYQAQRGPRSLDTGRLAELLASIRTARRDHAGAEQALLLTLAVWEAEVGPGAPRVAAVLDLLAEAARYSASDRALAYLQRALTVRRAALGPDHPEVARTLVALGSVFLEACRAAEAEAVLREALANRERTQGATSAAVVEPLEKLAAARWQLADDAGSEQLVERAVAVLEPLAATETERLVHLLGELASKERERKDFKAASASGERAVAAAEAHVPRTSPVLVAAADSLAATYRGQDDEARVTALFQRLALVERVLPPGAPHVSAPRAASLPPVPRCTPRGRGGSVSNVTAVVVGLQRPFRDCYNLVLRQDPNQQGSLRMTAKIGPAGEVARVRTLVPASYAEGMVVCPMQRLLEAHFPPPEGGGATVVIPLTYVSR